jgi:hypothetical protein
MRTSDVLDAQEFVVICVCKVADAARPTMQRSGAASGCALYVA